MGSLKHEIAFLLFRTMVLFTAPQFAKLEPVLMVSKLPERAEKASKLPVHVWLRIALFLTQRSKQWWEVANHPLFLVCKNEKGYAQGFVMLSNFSRPDCIDFFDRSVRRELNRTGIRIE